MKKLKLLFIIKAFFFFFAGIALFWLFKPWVVKAIGLAAAFLAAFAIFLFIGYGRYFPLPRRVMRFISINIFFLPGRVIGRLAGFGIDDIRVLFINANNSLSDKPFGKILLLLPSCLQNSECVRDLSQDVSKCIACGRCPIAEILEITRAKDIKIVLAGGGRQALEEINSYDPDSIIAVACEAELIDGIRAVTNKPVQAIYNKRPEGPCKNTRVEIKYIKDLL